MVIRKDSSRLSVRFLATKRENGNRQRSSEILCDTDNVAVYMAAASVQINCPLFRENPNLDISRCRRVRRRRRMCTFHLLVWKRNYDKFAIIYSHFSRKRYAEHRQTVWDGKCRRIWNRLLCSGEIMMARLLQCWTIYLLLKKQQSTDNDFLLNLFLKKLRYK